MNQSTVICPVPLEQQPINEYQELAQSWFFRWATLSKWEFAGKLTWVGSLSLLICAPISGASFSPQETFLPFLICSLLGSSLFVGFALVRLYLGWKYIADRLRKTKIVYEESSWYDGQVWEKPLEFYRRDQLIFQYQVQPLLKRLQKSLIFLLGLIIMGGFSLWLTN
ncbi:CGLD27 family protein [Geminocystis sp. CENA526]|uniref:CGLD27 family protein n=1 Tax=Geminocystis sp. CENA526 TaxID=1355871 RepID=UPI003D6F9DE9